ncbi:MAG: phosphatidylglycerophosphatase A [Betaproteobacteria bacterium]|nr:phosphatidylglycerophosphatase A [Betaproteobacteria bacterium]
MSAEHGDPIVNPSWRLVLSRPAHFIAFGFGVGKSPVAPGTFGTLLAFPLFAVLAPRLEAHSYLMLVILLFIIGVWACGVTGKFLRAHDHGGMVWDEVVAFLLVLFFTPQELVWQAFAFLLFRLFDVLKPPPIRHLERTLPGGLGVMADDLMAAFYTLLALALWKTLVT